MNGRSTLDRLAELAAGDPTRRAIAEQEIARAHCLRDHVTPGDLAAALDPVNNRQVPWLRKLDLGLVWVAETEAGRLLVSAPSQEGKSQRVIWFAVWSLVIGPDTRVVILTHSEELALAHSERIRAIIAQYGTGARDAQTGAPMPDRLGIGLGDKTAAGRWTLAGRRGGVTALGVKSALPGISADLLILDDLHSSAEAAESRTEQRKLRTVWDTAIKQRLSPSGRVVSIGTRFGVGDIQSYLLGQEKWVRLNFPAIADPGILDSLRREPGTPLESARGVREWEAIKTTTPSQTWQTMYQGDPVPAEGGLFKRAWFDDQRVSTVPLRLRVVVAVDPADSGHGDEAGIVVLGLAPDGVMYLLADHSGRMTSDQWARRAVEAAHTQGRGDRRRGICDGRDLSADRVRRLNRAALAGAREDVAGPR